MKTEIISTLFVVMLLGVGCRKTDTEKNEPGKVEAQKSSSSNELNTVILNEETQKRIGLETELLAQTNLVREVKGFGRVLDPAPLAALAAEVASAQIVEANSRQELTRLKSLGENASVKTLQLAEANSQRDELAVETARIKLKLTWGKNIAAQKNFSEFVQPFVAGEKDLIRIDLPAGEVLPSKPAGAHFTFLNNPELFNAEFLDGFPKIDEQSQAQSFLFVANHLRGLLPGAAINGFIQVSGEPMRGVIVKRAAILRHEGKSWVYMKTATDHFVRREINLEIPTDNGWFVSNFPANSAIVSRGAQTLLSEENKNQNLSGD